MDPDDNLHPELSEEYGLSELILKRDDSQKKAFGTNNMVVELVSIQVKPALRNRGIATNVLNELTLWADDNNVVLVGDPDDMFKTPLDVLYKLYGKFGFERSEKYNPTPNAWGKYHKIVRFPR
jgi:GNAT superfamily N-acetyltransferase